VRKDACGPGCDVSVPISMAYNHHHDTAIVGKGSHMEEWSREEAMATVRAVPGAVKRRSRFPMQVDCVWGFCMGAQGA
jgi:hypothetical protein